MGDSHRAVDGAVEGARREERLERGHDGSDGGDDRHGFRLGHVVVDGVRVGDVVRHRPVARVD